MIQSNSASHAKSYFSNALSKADYYINDQELNGRIQGKLAERLGLSGPATKDAFFSLCENINPKTGKPLSPRTNQERTVGYDINFHCPKSASILHVLSKDDHILKAFEASVQETMRDIERDSQTRVRLNGKQEDRTSGELIWADFIHQTARPTPGQTPDPHLHCHAYVFNQAFDPVEKRVKAGQFREIKRNMPLYQAAFQKRLSDKLMQLGYQIERNSKGFEVAGVPKEVIELFSKRTNEIGKVAAERGISSAKGLDQLGARTRSAKQNGMTMDELKADWKRQIRELDAQGKGGSDAPIRHAEPQKTLDGPDAQACLDYAIQHSFERASVIDEHKLLAEAIRYGTGWSSASLDEIQQAMRDDGRIIHVNEKGRSFCTTREVLAEERQMVELARQGQGKMLPLYRQAPDIDERLGHEQRQAVEHVLTTSHRVSIVRGTAGSGKTTLMQEAVRLIEASGKQVTVVAPTALASRGVLRKEGFDNAETVSKLLVNEKMQENLKGQVLWVDEAGLLGTGDMKALLALVNAQDAQLVLGGDTRQHSSVARGDSLRILNTVAGIQVAEVSKIHRQHDERYKAAVEDLSRGDVASAITKLDALDAIQEENRWQGNQRLVSDYVDALERGKSAVIISPTHANGEAITSAVREGLRSAGRIGKKEIQLPRLVDTSLTDAQRSDWRLYEPGQKVRFNQNVPGVKRGSLWTVVSTDKDNVRITGEGGEVSLPLARSKAFSLYKNSEIAISKGDELRITRNAFDLDERRLDNGQVLEVVGLDNQGKIMLRNKVSQSTYRIDREFGHLSHAYCMTSHAAQGKTVDEVFISQPATTFGATNAKQFYVSVSRGRDRCRIYTDDRVELIEQASEMGERQSALELVDKRNPSQEIAQHHQRAEVNQAPTPRMESFRQQKSITVKERNYEPGF